MDFYHIVHTYEPFNPNLKRRLDFARRTWNQFSNNWKLRLHQLKPTDRTSQSIGDRRQLPFIQDVIGQFLPEIPHDGIIVFTNTDSCLAPETENFLIKRFSNSQCCWCHRVDYSHVDRIIGMQELSKRSQYPGGDFFAFRKKWWNKIKFPDMILGCHAWDGLLFAIMGNKNKMPPLVYHEIHSPGWRQGHNKGNDWNSALLKQYIANKNIKNCFWGIYANENCQGLDLIKLL